MALQIENINKSFGTDVILKDISITASDGDRVGLIGPNGAGKTTLLKIIASELSCDSGRIMTPKDSKIGFLRQNAVIKKDETILDYMKAAFSDTIKLEEELRILENSMAQLSDPTEHDRIMKAYGAKSELFEKRGGFEMDAEIMTVLNGMGFADFDLNMKASNLSGGEMTKLSMARLLVERPDILLLDEPTNHLDFKTMSWLEDRLKSYRGIVIAVSHDRYFLDTTANVIYDINRTYATRYTGNYSQYLITKEQNEKIQIKHYNAQQEKIKHLEDYVARNGVRASTAKSAKSKQKALDKMILEEKPQSSQKSCRFKFESVFRSYNEVITAENVSLKVPKGGILKTLCKNINFELLRGQKIALVGINGVGKSTLLKSIVGEHKFFDGEIEIGNNVKYSYYDQQLKQLNDSKTVFGEISDRYPLMDEVEIRSKLGLVLFTEDDAFKNIKDLSGGERARLMFLIIMLQKSNLLILDEPTNHLDLPAKEALDSAISEYEGTVLFVSHDRYFANKTADKIYELTCDGINKYDGNYEDYINAVFAKEPDTKKSVQKPETPKVNNYEVQKQLLSTIRSLTKKVQNAEQRIEELEKQIICIDEQLQNCGSDFEKANELYQQKDACQSELDAQYELWEKYNSSLENFKK